MITTHRLPAGAFTDIANGDGDLVVVRCLREAQHSKHLMLLQAIAQAADGSTDPACSEVVAFWAGYKLLARAQAADPGAVAWVFNLPHVGAWAHDCFVRLDQGLRPDFGYFTCAAATAAVRAGIRFEMDVPVSDGQVLLPGLGCLNVTDQASWTLMRSDGEHLTVGTLIDVPCASLGPDDGSGRPIPNWRGTPLIRAVAEGHAWDVLLEVSDRYLDRYTLPMSATLSADQVTSWRQCIQSAWQVLVRHHGWASGPMADALSVIVPLTQRSDADCVSETTPAAFGAIATSWPPDQVIMAETLVHEFQHLKLCGLLDMVPLIEPGGKRTKVYAPWRQDPRPASGLLQGVYAHLGIVRFWDAQRHVETDPNGLLRAQVMFERWQPMIEQATNTLLSIGCLTPVGVEFVNVLRDQGRGLESESVPAHAREMAREVALDHWLTWQLRHTAIDDAQVASLAAAYQRGGASQDEMLPGVRIEEYTRKIGSTARSRMLNMRYLEPRRFQNLRVTGVPGLSKADGLLIDGKASAAVQAYCDEIAAATERVPDSWIGLALAIHRLPPMPLRRVFATKLSLMFDMHDCLIGQGVRSDPMDLAAWFA